MDKSIGERIFSDYLIFCEKYSEEVSLPVFGRLIIMFVTKMLRDAAPSETDFRVLVDEAINEGVTWHYEEKK